MGRAAASCWQLADGDWWATPFRRKVGEDYPKPWEVWVVDFGVNVGMLTNKYYFSLCRLPDRFKEKPPIASQYILYGKSPEFKWSIGSTFPKENEERRKILDEFIRKLQSQGFEAVDRSVNETLKKCELEEPGKYLWYYHVLLKRR